MTRVAIVGAGAIGCLLAARLSSTPAEVTLVARSATADIIRRTGITMVTPLGRVQRKPVSVTDDAMAAGQQDIVFVCVKAYALGGTLDALSQLLGPQTILVPMVNGIPWWYPLGQGGPLRDYRMKSVDPDDRLGRAIPADNLVGSVVWSSVEGEGPGRVHHIDDQRFIFGDPFDRPSAAVDTVVALFGQAGFQAQSSTDIRADIWTKLWANIAFNPLSALTGVTLGPLLSDPGTRSVARSLMEEASRVGEALGIQFGSDIDARIEAGRAVGTYRTSMLQDMEAGRRLEVDAILRAVTELGALVGVATPTVDAIASLVEMKARQRGEARRSTAA